MPKTGGADFTGEMVINSSSYGRSSNDTHMWAHVHKQDMVGGVRARPRLELVQERCTGSAFLALGLLVLAVSSHKKRAWAHMKLDVLSGL